jgi:hypothetical protein
MERSGQSGQSGHISCLPFEGFDRCKPLAICHGFTNIDGGPLASDHPPPLIFVVRVRQPAVPAVFEKESGVAGIFAIFQPLDEAVAIEAAGSADDVADDERIGPSKGFDEVAHLALLLGAHGVCHFPERLRLRRRRFGVEAAEIERPEIVGDRLRAARIEPRPVWRPVGLVEGAPLDRRPSDEVAAVVGRKEESADLVGWW